MSIFKKKKLYCVEWHSAWGVPMREYIKAKDKASAWATIKNKETVACFCDNIIEIKINEREIR